MLLNFYLAIGWAVGRADGQMHVAAGEFDRARIDFAILGIANLAVGEKIEKLFSLFGRWVIGENVAAKAADEAEPIAEGEIERSFDLAAKALRDGGAFAGSGDCDSRLSGQSVVALRPRKPVRAGWFLIEGVPPVTPAVGWVGAGREPAGGRSEGTTAAASG